MGEISTMGLENEALRWWKAKLCAFTMRQPDACTLQAELGAPDAVGIDDRRLGKETGKTFL